MRSLTKMTDDELKEAHHAADVLISEKFRSYLPGRMLPMLLGRFRDDIAEAMGMEVPPLPRSAGPVADRRAERPGRMSEPGDQDARPRRDD